MLTYTCLKKSGFRFSPDDPQMVDDDRSWGIIRFGPYRRIAINAPRLAFVFPEGYRDAANSLYLALRNGIGAFKGLPSVFKFALEKDQVYGHHRFHAGSRDHHHDGAHLGYRDAYQAGIQANRLIPDIFITYLHPRSMTWDED